QYTAHYTTTHTKLQFIYPIISHPSPTLQFSTFFFFKDTATTEIYTLSLHDALPIWQSRHAARPCRRRNRPRRCDSPLPWRCASRSEEHTSELQSQSNLVCRLLLEKKKKKKKKKITQKYEKNITCHYDTMSRTWTFNV